MTPQQRKYWVGKMGARTEWWARRKEAIIEPGWPIVDAHFHLWQQRHLPDPQDGSKLRTSRYMTEEFLRDAGSGHKVEQAVYIECGSGYYPDGPEHLRPVGETEFAVDLASRLERAGQRPGIGAIVAHAELQSPHLETILDAHAEKGGGKVRGIRQSAARLDDPSARLLAGAAPPGLCADPGFRRGVALLGERGFVFDAFVFHSQLSELADLARATPQTTIVVNHLGAPIGFGRSREALDAVFTVWAEGIEALAELPNTVMKLGGMASIVTEYDGNERDRPPSSSEFVEERGAYFHHAIRRFGAERCMFESNFPVDSISIGYAGLWNAYKRIAMEYDTPARQALLAGTARRVYGM